MRSIRVLLLAVIALVLGTAASGDPPAKDQKKSPRDALRPLGDLIGEWRAVGTPAGSREEQEKGVWDEKMFWEWKFKGDDAWLTVVFKDGKHFSAGEMHY